MDIDAVIDQIYGAIYFRILLGLGMLNSSYMDTLFENVMGGLGRDAARAISTRTTKMHRGKSVIDTSLS